MVQTEYAIYFELGPADKVHEGQITKMFILSGTLYGFLAVFWAVYLMSRKNMSQQRLRQWRVSLVCISWSFMSIGMQGLNKSVVSSFGVPALVTTVQMLIAVICMSFWAAKECTGVPRYAFLCWMVVPLFYSAMLCTSTYTFQYISLSLMTVVRNFAPFIGLPTEYFLMPPEKQPYVSVSVVVSFGITLAGTVVYADGMLKEISWVGVAFAFGNMILAVADRVIQRYLLTGVCKQVTSSVCTVLNNGIGMLPTMVLAVCTNQVSHLNHYPQNIPWTHPQTLILLICSGLVGIGICYLGFECQREISATSFFVMNNLSKVAVIFVGIIIFGDPIRSLSSILGLVLSVGGGMMYGWVQLTSKKSEALPLLQEKGFPSPAKKV